MGPIQHRGDAERAPLVWTGCGKPDPTRWLGADAPSVTQALDEERTVVLGATRLAPIHPRCPLSPGVRRHAPDCQAARGFRVQAETVQPVDCRRVATQCGSLDPLWPAVHRTLQLSARAALPSPRVAPVGSPSLPLRACSSGRSRPDGRADVSGSFGAPQGPGFFGTPAPLRPAVWSPAPGIDLPAERSRWFLRSIGACDAAVGPRSLPGSASEDRDASLPLPAKAPCPLWAEPLTSRWLCFDDDRSSAGSLPLTLAAG
jgi:hypothetical protein